VPGGDPFALSPKSALPKELIARIPAGFFEADPEVARHPRHVRLPGEERNAKPIGEGGTRRLVSFGSLAHAVVQVRRHDIVST
jgi:hypothetical protein